jgi:hypothetical protein
MHCLVTLHKPTRPVAKRHFTSGRQTWPSSARERKLAQLPFPGVFGVFYQSDRPTKNALEKKWIESSREKNGNASDLELLQKTFDRMK